MIIKYLLLGFLFYLIYKFVFNIVLPIYRTTKKVKQQFSEMQQKVNETFGTHSPNNNATPQKETYPQKKSKEYIDFEEVGGNS
jgi:hypothetical protein